MERFGNILIYLLFPLVGLLLVQTVPPEKFPLRFLILLVFCTLGVIAADSGARLASVRTLRNSLGAARGRLNVRPARSAALFMALALVFMALCAQELRPAEDMFFNFTVAIEILIVGLICLWLALRLAAPPVQIALPTAGPLQPEHSNLLLALLGALLLLAAGEAAGKTLGFELLYRLPVPYQALLFYGGILLLVMGLGGMRRFGPIRTRLHWLTERRRELALVLLIFIGALAIRAWQLNPGLHISVDEALAVDGVGHYYGGRIGLVAPPSQYITSLLFPQWQGVLLNILGRTVMVLRLTSAVTGALTVVATYYLARDLFNDRRTGLVAALFLMTFPPHIHFSRIALLHIADPLFGTLALWFLVRGIQWNRRLDWALAGASLGLTQYFFEAGRLFYAPLAVAWLVAVVVFIVLRVILKGLHWLPLLRRLLPASGALPRLPLKGILITAVAFILVATPTYYAVFSLSANASPRLSASGGFDLITEPLKDGLTEVETVELARRLFFPLSIYVHQPEIAVYYGGDQPMLLVYVVPFFLLGMGYLIWRWRSVAFIIPLWILATAGINSLLRDSAVYTRWIVVLPGIAVVVGVALRYLLPILWSRQGHSEDGIPILVYRRYAPLLVGGVLAVIMVAQVRYYFSDHVPLLEKQARLEKPYPDVFDAALRSIDLPSWTDIYLIGDPIPDINVPRSWIDFFATGDRLTLRYFPMSARDFTTEYVQQLPLDRNLALFVDPHADDVIALMHGRLGCTLQRSPYPIDPPEKGFLLCYVPMRFDRWDGL